MPAMRALFAVFVGTSFVAAAALRTAASMAWILKGAHDSTLRKAWDNIQADKIKRDRVVTYKAGNVYSLDGTLGEPDDKGETIPFTVDGDKLTPKLANITGMSFYREPR